MIKHKLTVTLMSSIVILSACEKKELWMPRLSDNTPPKMENRAEFQDSATRESNIKSTRQEIDKLKNELDQLEEKAKQSSVELRSKLEKNIQILREDLKIVEKKWQELKEAGATSWKKTSDSLKTLIDKLNAAIHEASRTK